MSLPKHLLAWSLLLTFFAGHSPVLSMDRPAPAVAVWDLNNLNPKEAVGTDMGELLASEVIETLKEAGTYQVVERQSPRRCT